MATSSASARECAELLLNVIPDLMRGISGRIRQRKSANDEPFGISQVPLLGAIGRQVVSLRELAEIHHVRPSTMSRSVEALVQRGWVERKIDPRDRRQISLSLTAEGRTAFESTVEEMRTVVADLFVQLDPSERERLRDGLQVLTNLLERTRTENVAPHACPTPGVDLT